MEQTTPLNIRGLVTVINQSECLEDFNLTNTRLIIDADSLAHKIVSDVSKELACFNGGYDMVAIRATNFFKLLQLSNVTPYVIFFGPADVHPEVERMETRLKNTLQLNSSNFETYSVSPYKYTEIVEDVAKRFKFTVMRLDCVDHVEMAIIAKNLMYPVLSWNLEYYLLDVNFIPGEHMPLSLFCTTLKYIPCELFIPTLFYNSAYKVADKRLRPILALILGENDIDDLNFEELFDKLKIQAIGDDCIRQIINWIEKCIEHEPIESILKRVLDVLYGDHFNKEGLYRTIIRIIAAYHSDRESEYLQTGLDRYAEIFRHKYRECVYPKDLINMVTLNIYLLDPLIEEENLPHAHTVSLEIIGAIHKILKKTDSLTIYVRVGKEICQQLFPDIALNFSENLTLSEIVALDIEERRNVLLKILDLEDVTSTQLETMTTSWILLILTFKYLKNKSRFSWPIIYSIILCKIMIMYVDPYVGPIRSRFEYVSKMNPALKTREILYKNEEYMPYIWLPDAALASELLVRYFELRNDMVVDSELFNRSLMHCISEVQSCIIHINHFNALLDCPFEKICLGDTFNGTFIYNFSSKIMELGVGSDSANKEEFGYNVVNTMVSTTGTVFDCFMITTQFLKSIL